MPGMSGLAAARVRLLAGRSRTGQLPVQAKIVRWDGLAASGWMSQDARSPLRSPRLVVKATATPAPCAQLDALTVSVSSEPE